MRVVFGIGNPGPEYRQTRHNLGFAVIHAIAEQARADIVPISGLEAEGARVSLGDTPLLLVKPLTYVNLCGPVLAGICRRLSLPLTATLTVVDDLNLLPGRLRLRAGGGDGGHNGLQSLTDHLASPDFPRLRIGIGAPPEGRSVTDHVLGRFGESEVPAMQDAILRAVEAVRLWVGLGLEKTVPQVNRRS